MRPSAVAHRKCWLARIDRVERDEWPADPSAEEDIHVRRSAVASIAIAILLATSGCGGTAFIISPGEGTVFFASGTVTFVQFTINDGVGVTVVILTNGTLDQTFQFCGDVATQFPSDSFVRTRYKHSVGCDTVVQVTL
jgi:hypothetical protein